MGVLPWAHPNGPETHVDEPAAPTARDPHSCRGPPLPSRTEPDLRPQTLGCNEGVDARAAWRHGEGLIQNAMN